jgi:hypothetical protein
MLMPEDVVCLRAIQNRRRELAARKRKAERSDPLEAAELQADLDELEADYKSIIAAAVLI